MNYAMRSTHHVCVCACVAVCSCGAVCVTESYSHGVLLLKVSMIYVCIACFYRWFVIGNVRITNLYFFFFSSSPLRSKTKPATHMFLQNSSKGLCAGGQNDFNGSILILIIVFKYTNIYIWILFNQFRWILQFQIILKEIGSSCSLYTYVQINRHQLVLKWLGLRRSNGVIAHR